MFNFNHWLFAKLLRIDTVFVTSPNGVQYCQTHCVLGTLGLVLSVFMWWLMSSVTSWVSIGYWAYGLLSDGTKPLPEPTLTYHQWGPLAYSWGPFHSNCSRYNSFQNVQNVYIWKCCYISQGPIIQNDAFSESTASDLNLLGFRHVWWWNDI